MPIWRRALSFVLPSLVAAVLAAASAGLIEGAQATYTLFQALAAAGFFAGVAVPLVFGVSLAVRGVWIAWGVDDLIERSTEDTGGAPGIVAWITYALFSLWFVTAVTFNAVRLILIKTSAHTTVALGSAGIVLFAVGVLVLLSRPGTRLLAWVYRKLDAVIARKLGRSIMKPRYIAYQTLIALVALAYGGWRVSVRPRIGHLDVTFVYYLAFMTVVAGAVQLAWTRIAARKIVATAVTAFVLIAGTLVVGSAAYARYAKPYAMLEVWGNTQLAGGAIDTLFDIQSLRGELRLGEFAPVEREGAPRYNVIFVSIDTVRADRTTPYGGKVAMPALGKMGKNGAVFEWAFSPGNVTRRSLPTMALGISPNRVRGRVAGWALRLDPRHVLLAERFRAAGYETAGFFCCEAQFGPRHRLGLIRGLDELTIEYEGAPLTEQAVEWFENRDWDTPTFTWIHYIEPHLWEKHYPSKKHGKSLFTRYDKSLRASDAFLAELMKVLASDERAKDTIVVVTADHGEGLGDHGFRNHSTTLYNAQIRVPLVVVGPGIDKQRIRQPVGLVDLPPTLLDLAGFEPPTMPDMDGTSVAPILRGERKGKAEGGEAYAVMVEDRSVDKSHRALIVGRYKLIERDGTDKVELYDIVSDPDEKRNIAGVESKAEVLEQMRERMKIRRELDAIYPF
jgi:arylsulfatase A-like enzyme